MTAMYYGIYRNIRDCAWQCLLDFRVDRLPVNISQIARNAHVHVIKNSLCNKLRPNEHARSYYDGKTWIIVYNDANDATVSRFAIAHELGHYFLGHPIACAKYAHLRDTSKKSKSEQQADMFALRVLCPACVLKDMNINSPEDVANICRVPLSCAEIRYQRLNTLNSRLKYFTAPIEREVYNNFKEYLEKNKNK